MKQTTRARFFIKWILVAALPAAALVQFITSCDSGTTPPLNTLPARYFKDSVQVIFNNNCIGCHQQGGNGWSETGSSDSGGLDLTNAYATLVNQASYEHRLASSVPRLRVKPGFPDSSYLFHKINMDSPEYGGRMPLYGSPLSDDEIATIKKWILNGAPLGDTTTH